MNQIKIAEGPHQGTYELSDAGKIVQIKHSAGGAVRITVGRGTSRHLAVSEASKA